MQGGFYLVGGGFLDWTTLMRQMFKEVHGNTTNVATYIGPGGAHCQDADDVFYTDSVRARTLGFSLSPCFCWIGFGVCVL